MKVLNILELKHELPYFFLSNLLYFIKLLNYSVANCEKNTALYVNESKEYLANKERNKLLFCEQVLIFFWVIQQFCGYLNGFVVGKVKFIEAFPVEVPLNDFIFQLF